MTEFGWRMANGASYRSFHRTRIAYRLRNDRSPVSHMTRRRQRPRLPRALHPQDRNRWTIEPALRQLQASIPE